jgi:hypothetical protein
MAMTYLDKYPNCNGCPVEEYCGTVVGSIRLCHSYNEDISEKESSHVLTLSKAAPDLSEEEYIEEKMTVWDNITD